MADTTRPAPAHTPHPGFTALDLAALGLVLALGLVNLMQPLAWDQAMFALGAQRMHHGGVLYRDYWDPKQPGLFFFYELAGALFGFGAVGFHALELLALLGLALALLITLRGRFAHRWIASLTPLLTIGWYYAVTSDWHLTQIESLVGLPLYLCGWWAVRAAETAGHRTRHLLLSGAMGGLVLSLKIVFVPILLAIWLVALWRMESTRTAQNGPGPKFDLGMLGIALLTLIAGALIALAPIAAYFAANHAAALAWWTTFVYPGEALAELHTLRVHYLLTGLHWFGALWSPLLILMVLGLRAAARRELDALVAVLGMWLAVGFFVLMIQSLSYWEYQYLLLSVPVGVLAAHGLDAFWPKIARPATRAALVLALVAIPLVCVARKTAVLARHRFAIAPADRAEYRAEVSFDHAIARIMEDAGFLMRPQARPGAIWVMGNPMIYWLTGREQAVPRNGASFIEYASAAEWMRLTRSLEQAQPVYVFVSESYLPMISRSTDKCAGFLNWLATEYRVLHRTREGFWFERASAVRPGS
jgi:hypothetical protein